MKITKSPQFIMREKEQEWIDRVNARYDPVTHQSNRMWHVAARNDLKPLVVRVRRLYA